jgi:hypothetical protein
MDMLGYIPYFLGDHDPRPAHEQFHSKYIGGWSPFKGFKMLPNGNLKYPGDPETQLLAEGYFREELIRFYQHSWVAIVQPDGTFEVSRMD